jgi:hypothetical protein
MLGRISNRQTACPTYPVSGVSFADRRRRFFRWNPWIYSLRSCSERFRNDNLDEDRLRFWIRVKVHSIILSRSQLIFGQYWRSSSPSQGSPLEIDATVVNCHVSNLKVFIRMGHGNPIAPEDKTPQIGTLGLDFFIQYKIGKNRGHPLL